MSPNLTHSVSSAGMKTVPASSTSPAMVTSALKSKPDESKASLLAPDVILKLLAVRSSKAELLTEASVIVLTGSSLVVTGTNYSSAMVR